MTQILAAPGFSFWRHEIKNVSVWISGKDVKTPEWTTNHTVSRPEALRGKAQSWKTFWHRDFLQGETKALRLRHRAGRTFCIVAFSEVKP